MKESTIWSMGDDAPVVQYEGVLGKGGGLG
jgi:hypothetical protein